MLQITESKYNAMHPDYRGIWQTERTDLANWNQIREKHIGKRTMMHNDGGGTCLLIEGLSFEIIPDYKPLREVAIYYKNIGPKKLNELHTINMAAHLTDQEIHTYFKPGKLFNLGCGPFDLMAEVEKIEILK